MDIITYISKHTGLSRSQIGVCGLKDKKAITSQRISINLDELWELWTVWGSWTNWIDWTTWISGNTWHITQEKLRRILSDAGATIRGETYAHTGLSVWSHEWNVFYIRLRAKRPISDDLKTTIEHRLAHIDTHGFPNCYGQQRFGKNNFQKAKSALASWDTDWYHLKLKLQAYPNMYFNTLALERAGERYTAWDTYIDGDICIHQGDERLEIGIYRAKDDSIYVYPRRDALVVRPLTSHTYTYPDISSNMNQISITQRTPRIRKSTGLMVGTDMLVCPPDSPANIYDKRLIDASNIIAYMDVARTYKLTSYRRPLTCYPSSMEYSRDGDDLCLAFGLGVWSYATVLLWWVFGEIDEMTCVQNKWQLMSV